MDVLNGSGDINYTRTVASRIGALAYRIDRVTRADRFDYPETAVYFHPGGEKLAARLARQLGVGLRPLPGGGRAEPARRRRRPGPALELEPELGEALLERRRHRLDDGLAHETPQACFEAIALLAVLAVIQMLLGLPALGVGQVTVDERLKHLFAPVAELVVGHHVSTATSASSFFRIRRPR